MSVWKVFLGLSALAALYLVLGFLVGSAYLFYMGGSVGRGMKAVRAWALCIVIGPIALFHDRAARWLDDVVMQ